jgi:hypothetical protein
MFSERLQILVSQEQRRRLELEAKARGTSVSAVIRAAIDTTLPRRFSRDERVRAAHELTAMRIDLSGIDDVDRLIDDSRLAAILDQLPSHS